MNEDTTDKNDTLPLVLIKLMKGVVYLDDDNSLWQQLLSHQSQVRDYVRMLGLELMISEDEGVAWLTSRQYEEDEKPLPRLVNRRQLSYPVSLLLVLLRRKLVEHDAQSGEQRLVIDREDIAEQLRVFLPIGHNEAKFADQVNQHINKVIEMGFIRRMKHDDDKFEIRRIIKAFVDAQWLKNFNERMQEYVNYQSEAKS